MPEQGEDQAAGPPIDLNRATARELGMLPGVGPAYAAAIVLAREQDGPFRTPEALVERGIIPERILERISDRVSTTAGPTEAPRASEPPKATPEPRRTHAAPAESAAPVLPGAKPVRAKPIAARPQATRRGPVARAIRGVLNRKSRLAVGVAATILAIAAFPLFTMLASSSDHAANDPPGLVSDATSPPLETPSDAGDTATPDDAGSPTAEATPAPTAVPVPDSPVRYVGNTGGDGVGLRTACEPEARVDGAWRDGTEVVIDERGTGTCFGWSLVSRGDTTSWVRNVYLVEQKPVAIVTGTSASLPQPGISRAQEHCIHYRIGSSYYTVCRTFPTLERSLWTTWDLGTYGHLSYERLQFFANCYVNNVRVGAVLDRCAFTPLNP